MRYVLFYYYYCCECIIALINLFSITDTWYSKTVEHYRVVLLSTYNIHLPTINLQANLGVIVESSDDQYNCGSTVVETVSTSVFTWKKFITSYISAGSYQIFRNCCSITERDWGGSILILRNKFEYASIQGNKSIQGCVNSLNSENILLNKGFCKY